MRCLLLLGRLPRKKNEFWVGKIIFLLGKMRDCGNLLRFLLFALSTAAWQIAPEKKMNFGSGKSFFYWEKCRLLCNLLRFLLFALSTATWQVAPEKNMNFGSGKSFFWREKCRLLRFAGTSRLLHCRPLLGKLPRKNDFWVGKIIFRSCSFFVALVDLFVVLVLCLLVLCLLFLFFVLLVWWFVLFPKQLRVGIQCPQWGKNTCEDCPKDWSYWPILGGYRFFFFLIVLGD